MLKNLLAVIAAAGLAVAPIAAQANTRADIAGISLQSAAASMPVAAQAEDDDDDDDLAGLWWLFGGAILIGVILVIAGDVDENSASPGAN